MAHVVINSYGTGAAQAGGAVTTTSGNKNVLFVNETDSTITLDLHIGGAHHSPGLSHTIPAKGYLNYAHTGTHGAATMVNVKTAHGTSAQTDERVYMYHKV
jgi:hypothetical protein